MSKRRIATALAKYLANPPVQALSRAGVPVPGTVLLETVGRTTGQVRRTPVTDGLDGDVLWIVAEHGREASYVRNIEAEPRVRVQLGRRWRSGTAHVLPDDDPHERLKTIGRSRRRSTASIAAVRLMQTQLLTVRVDLDA
jgi:deazaflavin-dependent oxidoreductase (nitroreductase family)